MYLSANVGTRTGPDAPCVSSNANICWCWLGGIDEGDPARFYSLEISCFSSVSYLWLFHIDIVVRLPQPNKFHCPEKYSINQLPIKLSQKIWVLRYVGPNYISFRQKINWCTDSLSNIDLNDVSFSRTLYLCKFPTIPSSVQKIDHALQFYNDYFFDLKPFFSGFLKKSTFLKVVDFQS